MTDDNQNPVRSSPRLILGVIVIVMGISMLADNLGWFSARYVLKILWPIALMGIGLSMVRDVTPRRRAWGLVIIIIGLWNLLQNFGWVHADLWHVLFPGILLFVGGTLVWRA